MSHTAKVDRRQLPHRPNSIYQGHFKVLGQLSRAISLLVSK